MDGKSWQSCCGFVPAGDRFTLRGYIYELVRASEVAYLDPVDCSGCNALRHFVCRSCPFAGDAQLCKEACCIIGGCTSSCRRDGVTVCIVPVGELVRTPVEGYIEGGVE